MATSYSVKGTLTTTTPATDLNNLRVVAYKFLSSSTMQIFGVADVDATGKFTLAFERSGVGPEDVYIAPIPIEIERFGIFNIQRTLIGTILSPRRHINAGDWTSSGTDYTYAVTLAIPGFTWRLWDWLSEEFTVLGRAVKRVDESLLPLPFTWVGLADVDAPEPFGAGIGGAETDEEGNFVISFRRLAFFINYASRPWPTSTPIGVEVWPDVIFSMTQIIGGTKTRIYQEEASDARPRSMWDEPHRLLYVTLVSDEGVTNDETYPAIPENFLLHGIGVVDPHSITDGYATAPAAGAFQVIEHEHWTASKYEASTHSWNPVAVSPVSGAVAGELVYEIPDYTDITLTKKTRLIKWTTQRRDSGIARYPDGKYDLLVRAWDAAGCSASWRTARHWRWSSMPPMRPSISSSTSCRSSPATTSTWTLSSSAMPVWSVSTNRLASGLTIRSSAHRRLS